MAEVDPMTAKPFDLVVDLSKVREMCKALGMPVPTDDAAPVPPTFLTTMRHWITPESDAWRLLGFDGRRTLHAAESYTFEGGPLRIGQRLVGRSRIESRYEKTSRSGQTLRFAVMVTEYRNQQGDLVATARLTGVEVPET